MYMPGDDYFIWGFDYNFTNYNLVSKQHRDLAFIRSFARGVTSKGLFEIQCYV